MDKQQIFQIANSNPEIQQMVQQMSEELSDMPITAEGLGELIKMVETAIDNPERYAEIRQAAIADGMVEEDDMPPEFDQTMLISILAVLYRLQEQYNQQPPQQFARGGLAQVAQRLQSAGRNGDTMLAHITPEEAMMLRRMGGSGSINPNTGLPEFSWFKKVFNKVKKFAPLALSILAPGLGTAIGSALGASAAWAPVLGGALLGGTTSRLAGGDFGQGALFGGLGGGLGKMLGSTVNSALGTNMSAGTQAMLGSSLAGGVGGMATGKGFTEGALQGGLGQMVGNSLSKLGGFSGSLGQGINAGGSTFGNALSAGYDPKKAAEMGTLSGVAAGLSYKPSGSATGLSSKPSDLAVDGLKMKPLGVGSAGNSPLSADYNLTPASSANMGGGSGLTPSSSALPGSSPSMFSNLNLNDALKVATLSSALQSAPAPAQQAVEKMSPEQQEYFNRPSVYWNWDKLQADASNSGMDLSNYMAQNWDKISSGVYNSSQPGQVAMAKGGALSKIAYMARGSGSGRADTIDAKLSDGEYVMDAETVALLGDGSSKEGARRLDMMRENLRTQKGKALSKGKFSPNAKSPLAYLKEVA